MELALALKAKGIRLILYLPANASQNLSLATATAMGLETKDANNCWHLTEDFKMIWRDVIAEWSMRYGKEIAGWWFDGCYTSNGFDDTFAKWYSQGAKSGNSDSLVAFNGGTANGVDNNSPYEDYAAGEQNIFTLLPNARYVNGSQWHVMSYLGNSWVNGEVMRYTADEMKEYIQECAINSGVVSMEVALEPVGRGYRLNPDALDLLRQVNLMVGGTYKIIAKHSGKSLSLTDKIPGSPVIQSPATGIYQHWIVPPNTGSFEYVPVKSKCLGGNGALVVSGYST